MPKMMSGKVVSVFTRPWPGIGDAAYCALLARELKTRYPNGRIICYSSWPQLFRHDPNIDEAHKVDPDHLINPVLPKRWGEHSAHISRNMCLAMGFDLEGPVRIPYYMSSEESEWAEEVLHAENCKTVVHARQRKKFGSNKDWPMDRWGELVKTLHEPVIQVGPESEPPIEGARDYRGLDIRQSLALVARCRVFITCDSGLYHVTSSFPKLNIVLLGERSHPDHFTYPGDTVLTGNFNCRMKYCDQAHCPLVGDRDFAPCMLAISIQDVASAVKNGSLQIETDHAA